MVPECPIVESLFALVDLTVLKPDEPETEKQGLIGIDHGAYTYASLEDLFANYEQLKVEGIKPYWCVHHGVTVSISNSWCVG